MTSLQAQKAQEQGQARRSVIESYADGGPYLESGKVIIPSPAKNETLRIRLKQAGFKFEWAGVMGGRWSRLTDKPCNGKRYTPQAWLDWAIKAYTEAWPNWGKGVSDQSKSQAIIWAMTQGCFKHSKHASAAFDKLKAEHKPKDAAAMTELWRSDVTRRKRDTALPTQHTTGKNKLFKT